MNLYLNLLQHTVKDTKRQSGQGDEGQPEGIEIDPEINLKVSAFIPAEYIPDLNQRYIAYRRIASVGSDEAADDLMAEFADRYGQLPQAAINLFSVITLKLELKKQRIVKLEEAPSALVFTFAGATPASPEQVLLYIQRHKKTARLTPDSRLVVAVPTASMETVFETARKIVRCLG